MQVRRRFAAVEGQRLTAVRYRYLEPLDGSAPSGYESSHMCVDTDLQVVTLEFETRPIVISWAIDDDIEGLHLGDERDGGRRKSLPTSDVSTRFTWTRLVGSALVGAAGSWYSVDGDEILWSIRLLIDDEEVVIALGGQDPSTHHLTYESDELVVIFDERIAKDYHRLPGDLSSWGRTLALR
jgi:hypothetical protein